MEMISTLCHIKLIYEGDDQIDAGGTRYMRSSPEEWTQVQEGGGRSIDPIPWTGGQEEFSVNRIGAIRFLDPAHLFFN